MESFKKGPLKKRPIVYVIDDEEPEDLSIKKRENITSFNTDNFCLDLSTNSVFDQIKLVDSGRNYYQFPSQPQQQPQLDEQTSLEGSQTPKSIISESSVSSYQPKLPLYYEIYSPNQSSMPLPSPSSHYIHQQPDNIHLRGLQHHSNQYSPAQQANYYSATTFQQYPEEMIMNSYHLTPPSSPISMPPQFSTFNEPEDLSIRNSIPIPALHYQQKPEQPTNNFLKKSKISKIKNLTIRFKCEKCSKSYSTSTGLSKHQHFHCVSSASADNCNQIKKDFSCQNCDKVYTTLGALKMHIRTHTLPCKCPICNKAFSRPWLLQGHIRTHTGEKPFSCQHCHRAFADRSNLRAHQQTHVQVKKYICDGCNKSFSRMSLLTKHIAGGCSCLTNLQNLLH